MVIQYNYFIAQTNICRLPFAALLDSLALIDQVANKMLQKKDCQQIPPDNTYPQQLTKKRMFLFWFWYLSFEYVCFVFPLVKQLCPWNSHLTALVKVLLLLWHPLSAAHICFGAVSCSSDLCFSLLLLSKFPPAASSLYFIFDHIWSTQPNSFSASSLCFSLQPWPKGPAQFLGCTWVSLCAIQITAVSCLFLTLEWPAQENDQPRHQDWYRC